MQSTSKKEKKEKKNTSPKKHGPSNVRAISDSHMNNIQLAATTGNIYTADKVAYITFMAVWHFKTHGGMPACFKKLTDTTTSAARGSILCKHEIYGKLIES